MKVLIKLGVISSALFFMLARNVDLIRIEQPDEDDFKYMQRTIDYTLSIGKCLEQPFGASIVRKRTGEVLCYGVNTVSQSPTWHGETKAIENCAAIYPDQGNNVTFWKELTLYTTGEPCPMCSAAILWSHIGRLVISTPMEVFAKSGFEHIPLRYTQVAEHANTEHSANLVVVEGVLSEITDPWFSWQFDPKGKCPHGCHKEGSKCIETSDAEEPKKPQIPDNIKLEL
ncbi:hypothetical protein K7432_013251 [Basidiobolus ranarum]|uniref:CMP/dCMP-type deaminase domain-containing protein n=1 Tax=Basidiobolus ranarum TaxID=34480 RepID=A0ABR2VS10_9FUNG